MIIQGTLLWFILDKYLGTVLSVAAFGVRSEVCDEAFFRNSQSDKPIGCFSIGAPSFMSDGILNAILLILCLTRFPPMWLHKGILNSPCLPILLILTKDKDNKVKILDWPYVLISFKENSSTG